MIGDEKKEIPTQKDYQRNRYPRDEKSPGKKDDRIPRDVTQENPKKYV